ncbi:hypothetical protein NE237_018993 [Protea cynaroides]|uniref:Uncharacterized protein n=1 Tax=Protea cynaroides TaxID=273540 RepID=A0A9Q0KB13_9MAGN|nr:hypothetical protein NE237_018993 [Protea cynaroides]
MRQGNTIAGLATHLSSLLLSINESSNLTISTRTIATRWLTARPSIQNEDRMNESKLLFSNTGSRVDLRKEWNKGQTHPHQYDRGRKTIEILIERELANIREGKF